MGNDAERREEVRQRYAVAATTGTCCGPETCDPYLDLTANSYSPAELVAIPSRASEASLGCGNPTAVADLRPGETVLDLGSGGGIDVLLSARRVGENGFVYGLDMTEEMLELSKANAAEAGARNVDFLNGYIEEIPLPDSSVDVVISNCVINLSTDKPAVFAEIARVLKPGGRIGITDLVADDHLSQEERAERGSWVGCIAGALSRSEFQVALQASGFTDITIQSTHRATDGISSAIIKASKPST